MGTASLRVNLYRAAAMVFLVWDGTVAAAMKTSAGSKAVLTGYGYPRGTTCRQ